MKSLIASFFVVFKEKKKRQKFSFLTFTQKVQTNSECFLCNCALCCPLRRSPSLLPPTDDTWISATAPLRLHHIVAVMACFGFLLG